MKKLAAIAFLAVLSFNWFGYQFVIDYFEAQHHEEVLASLYQDNYNDDELISIKVPFSIPYLNKSPEFERWNGELEMNGVTYKYVKRRFFSDSMEVLCLPDYQASNFHDVRDRFFQFANDLNHQGTEKKSDVPHTSYKNTLSEFCQPLPEWDFSLADERQNHPAITSTATHPGYFSMTDQPPDAIFTSQLS